jgi:hypothetical protein
MTDYDKLLVHSCDGCGGTLLLDPRSGWTSEKLDYANNTFGVYILCATCQAREDAREAGVPVQVGTRCVHKLRPGGVFSDLVVTAVDGDRITVAVVGLGGESDERKNEILRRCWPEFLCNSDLVFLRSELRMKGL